MDDHLSRCLDSCSQYRLCFSLNETFCANDDLIDDTEDVDRIMDEFCPKNAPSGDFQNCYYNFVANGDVNNNDIFVTYHTESFSGFVYGFVDCNNNRHTEYEFPCDILSRNKRNSLMAVAIDDHQGYDEMQHILSSVDTGSHLDLVDVEKQPIGLCSHGTAHRNDIDGQCDVTITAISTQTNYPTVFTGTMFKGVTDVVTVDVDYDRIPDLDLDFTDREFPICFPYKFDDQSPSRQAITNRSSYHIDKSMRSVYLTSGRRVRRRENSTGGSSGYSSGCQSRDSNGDTVCDNNNDVNEAGSSGSLCVFGDVYRGRNCDGGYCIFTSNSVGVIGFDMCARSWLVVKVSIAGW